MSIRLWRPKDQHSPVKRLSSVQIVLGTISLCILVVLFYYYFFDRSVSRFIRSAALQSEIVQLISDVRSSKGSLSLKLEGDVEQLRKRLNRFGVFDESQDGTLGGDMLKDERDRALADLEAALEFANSDKADARKELFDRLFPFAFVVVFSLFALSVIGPGITVEGLSRSMKLLVGGPDVSVAQTPSAPSASTNPAKNPRTPEHLGSIPVPEANGTDAFLKELQTVRSEWSSIASSFKSSSNSHLILGGAIGLAGFVVFYWLIQPLDFSAKELDTKTSIALLVALLPRLTILVSIEVLAGFFLRQYRNAIGDFKHFAGIKLNLDLLSPTYLLMKDQGKPSEFLDFFQDMMRRDAMNPAQSNKNQREADKSDLAVDAVHANMLNKILDGVNKLIPGSGSDRK